VLRRRLCYLRRDSVLINMFTIFLSVVK